LNFHSAGWQGDAVFHVTFSKGGAIEFAEAFQRAVRNGKTCFIIDVDISLQVMQNKYFFINFLSKSKRSSSHASTNDEW
jgi:hypothetical protein